MNKQANMKMAAYALVVGVVAALLRNFMKPAIPDNISLIIGGVLVVIALGIAVLEVKNKTGLFYAYGENWKGDFLANSGSIAGVACFFLHTAKLNGFVCALVLAAVLFALRQAFGKSLSHN